MAYVWNLAYGPRKNPFIIVCVMGTVAHHRKLEENYNLGTIQTQEKEG